MYFDKINCFSEIVIKISNVLIVWVFLGVLFFNVLKNLLTDHVFFVTFYDSFYLHYFKKNNHLKENIFNYFFVRISWSF